jgi:sugar/nucleoside kinase (ribokinase family)
MGAVGVDSLADMYLAELKAAGVDFAGNTIETFPTGNVIVLVESNTAQRTILAFPGANTQFSVDSIDRQKIGLSSWLIAQGHLLRYGDSALEAIEESFKISRQFNRQLALTLGAESVVANKREVFLSLLPKVDLIIGNREEAIAISGAKTIESAISFLEQNCENVLITLDGEGAYLKWGTEKMLVPAQTATPIDVTGAGDAFAGAFLYGITHGYGARGSMEGAARLAARAVECFGARVPLDSKNVWDQVFSS